MGHILGCATNSLAIANICASPPESVLAACPAIGQGPEGLAEYGYSREHRPDRVQVVLGLLLSREGMEYIVGMPLRRWKEVRGVVLSRPGRYHEVKDNLRVRGLRQGGHRYVVCHNPEEEERDRKGRVAEEARYDGKYVLRTNTSLPAEEMALDYKSLWQVRACLSGTQEWLRNKAGIPAHRGSCARIHPHLFPGPGAGSNPPATSQGSRDSSWLPRGYG